MNNKIILISKDVLRTDYLPTYGNKYWETPNIDELAKEGTIFRKHYTAAPSSAMSYTCMFSGLFAHEIRRKKYSEVKPFNQVPTLFDILQEKDYSCNVIWDKSWYKLAYRFSKVYGNNSTIIHNLDIGQKVGPHKIDNSKIKPNEAKESLNRILQSVDSLLNNEKLFLWIHLPHVIKGRTGYGSDIDLLDELIGNIRNRFDDDSIYISADHGHLNVEKGIPVYGFHVYEGAIRIPLITPRIDDLKEVNFPTSNIQLKDIILKNNIEQLNYVYSDSQYYLQENRKLSIIKDNYKYIYNKRDNTEELYDLEFDPNENVNLLINKWYDRNRFKYYNLNEIYHYPNWNKLENIYTELKAEKDKIWRQGSWLTETAYKLNNFRKKGYNNLTNLINSKKRMKGNFGAFSKTKYFEI